LSKAACHAVIVQKKRSAVKCGVNRQLQTIVSLPDQNAIKALLVGGVRIGQEKRIGRRVVGDEQGNPIGGTQVGGHLNRIILIGRAREPHLKLVRQPARRSGAHISASARRSLLKAAFEFTRYCNGFDCGCRFPNPRANPFPCFWMAAVQLFPSLQGLLDAVFDAQFFTRRNRVAAFNAKTGLDAT
jgi:hypothetical protein